jgi:hypothetical protein
MHRLLTLTGAVVLALLPCACRTPQTAATVASAAGTLADALAAAQSTATGDSAEALAANAAATQRAAILWFAQTGGAQQPVTVQGAGRTWTLSASSPDNLLFDELLVPPPVKPDAEDNVLRAGAGAPLIARWRFTPERKVKHPFLSEGGYATAVTATLDFKGSQARLRLHDPRVEQSVILAGRRQTLAGDFSSLRRWITVTKKQDKTLGMSGIRAMRRSDEYLDKMGLIALEPPSRDRIPAVLIHGLMSEPLTWDHAYSVLSADPAVTRRYQFYFFRYPTGVPVVYSAGKCREDLALLKRELNRIGNTAHRGRILLVGHSMGGLVTKTQVQSSGREIWESAFGARPEDLDLPPEEVAKLRRLIEFQPNPDINRVVFICTPHRGSKLAEGFIGAIGRKLISLPLTMLKVPMTVFTGLPPTSPLAGRLKEKGIPSSIENLSPESTYVKVSNRLPFKRGLHIHTIVGNKKGLLLDDPKCSDGVVPYTSAHLDGVESELVVISNHSAHEKPEAISEIRRILLLHAGK